tara:strand:+ start:2917 stop:3471 length:555 start_codon:yes stop_codon:yes gene_type:complete
MKTEQKINTETPRPHWEVIVGNIGTTYSGDDETEALRDYNQYVTQSTTGYGRASDEDVTLMRDGEPYKEHYGYSKDIACELSKRMAERGARARTEMVKCMVEKDPDVERMQIHKQHKHIDLMNDGVATKIRVTADKLIISCCGEIAEFYLPDSTGEQLIEFITDKVAKPIAHTLMEERHWRSNA